MKVIAISRFEYGTPMKLYEPGDEFDTDDDEHARLLVLAKRVKLVPDDVATRELKADDERKPNPYRDKYRDKYRNRYKHRQMKADE